MDTSPTMDCVTVIKDCIVVTACGFGEDSSTKWRQSGD